ncbi:CocE/NonD family hydrolase [Halobium palmae]|uniref:CocE/NonD family hydrolase n=1 Tax=Halobium palmae TaxID=1776492 RepID=A0ABD5RWV9_9EURY
MTQHTEGNGRAQSVEYDDRYQATERTVVWKPPTAGVGYGIVEETDVPVPMRDGVDLAANVYRPLEPGGASSDATGEFPVIVQLTGWGKDIHWGEAGEIFDEEWPGTGVGYEPWSPPVAHTCTFEAENPNFWVPQGYVLVVIDGRGFGRSPGTFTGYDAWGRDVYDAIEWAGERAWSNGNVGMSGVSIISILQYHAAEMDSPHLKAICPWQGTPDDLYQHGGIGPVNSPNSPETFPIPHDPAWDAPATTDPPTGEDRPEEELFEGITQPALICGSWASHGLFSRGDFRAFRLLGSDQKWLYTHGREKWATFYETEAQAFRKRFFDHFLTGTDDRILETPPVRLETRETLRDRTIRSASDFPLPDTEYRALSLDASSGALVEDATPDEERAVSYDSTAHESVGFDFTFEADTSLVGYHSLQLWVTPEETTDADLFVTVRKLDRAGEAVRFHGYAAPLYHPVALGFLRLSHRRLDEERSTPWEPQLDDQGETEPVNPGEPVACQVPIRPSATRYRAGETLRVEISGTFLGEDELDVAYPARYRGETALDLETINEGAHTIHTGGRYDSRLLVPDAPGASE